MRSAMLSARVLWRHPLLHCITVRIGVESINHQLLEYLRRGYLMTERSVVKISDNVIMDSTINVGNNTCPSCGASGNIRVMKCQEVACGNRFCDLCHPNCRLRDSRQGVLRFDSGLGSGPYCNTCLTATIKVEREKQQRIERENREANEIRRRAEQERQNQRIRNEARKYVEEKKEKDWKDRTMLVIVSLCMLVVALLTLLVEPLNWFAGDISTNDDVYLFSTSVSIFWNSVCSLLLVAPFAVYLAEYLFDKFHK